MPIFAGFMDQLSYTFYDSFTLPVRESTEPMFLFKEPLGVNKRLTETNMSCPGYFPLPQYFVLEKLRIEFTNYPAPWDIGEFIRRCSFQFTVGFRVYLQCPVRALIEPSIIEVTTPLNIEKGAIFTASIHPEKPLCLDGPVAGRLLMQGKLFRHVS